MDYPLYVPTNSQMVGAPRCPVLSSPVDLEAMVNLGLAPTSRDPFAFLDSVNSTPIHPSYGISVPLAAERSRAPSPSSSSTGFMSTSVFVLPHHERGRGNPSKVKVTATIRLATQPTELGIYEIWNHWNL
ncbi:hypothetical protein LDENG_00221260 [Lucifuga dentata]|nr:hypothetical protein LDENG_00221260 [Lucifuga dentata]